MAEFFSEDLEKEASGHMGVVHRLRLAASSVGGNVSEKLSQTIETHPTNSMFASLAVGVVLGVALTFLFMYQNRETY